MSKVLYYLPVDEKYLDQWEYYKVDKEMLKASYKNLYVCSSIISFLKNILKVNYVYAWWWHRSLPIILISRLLNKKIFVTGAIHLNDLKQENFFVKKNLLYKISLYLGLKYSTKSLFISNHQYQEIFNYYKLKNFSLLRSSLDKKSSLELNNIFQKKKSNLSTFTKEKEIIFSTIIWHLKSQYIRKGIFESLDAFEKLYIEKPHIKFRYIIAGKEGPDLFLLKKYIYKMKSKNNIEIQLNLSNEQKQKLLFESDYYVQPSFYEGFGNAVLEAMSNGCIPIVSNKTSQPEVVGETGIMVNDISVNEIYLSLNKVCNFSLNVRKNLLNSIQSHIQNNFTFDIRCKNFKIVSID